MQQYFIGVDIGTTSTKAVVFTLSGAVKGIGNRQYSILVPKSSWAEQDPDAIFAAVISATRDAIEQAGVERNIAAVGFSAAMHSLIVVDANGDRLTNSIIWADNRSIIQTEQLKQDGTGHALYLRTGTPIHPMSPLTKVMWMRDRDPDTFRLAAKFLSIKEYVFYQLFGCYLVDYSIASATGLFNLKQLNWDKEALAIAGIRSDQLSAPVPTTHILHGIKLQYAAQMGLETNTPVVIGANDGVLANLGVGAINPGQVTITIGTSSAVRTVVSTPVTDPKQRTFCYALTENQWVIGGPSNSGGIVLSWFREQFSWQEVEQAQQQNIDPYEIMIQAAAKVPAGSEGLLCLPFLAGERAPYWNANARGLFFGIGLHHKRSHFIRAVLEGILFSVYSIYMAVRDLAGEAHEIRASGGFVRSIIWRQMLADVLKCDVLIPEVYEASSFGAAAIAMLALGAIDNLADVQKIIHITERHEPHAQTSGIYNDLFHIYERIYSNLVEEFTLLADYQRTSGR